MEINLRRASVVQNAIREALAGHVTKLTGTINMELWRFSQGPAVVNSLRQEQLENLEMVSRLNAILGNIRSQVASANAVNGVTNLLGEQVMVKAQVAQFAKLAQCEPACDWAQVAEQVNHVVTSNGKNAYHTIDQIPVNIFSAQDIAGFQKQLVAARRRLNEISDALVAANVKSSITISADDWQWLESRGIV